VILSLSSMRASQKPTGKRVVHGGERCDASEGSGNEAYAPDRARANAGGPPNVQLLRMTDPGSMGPLGDSAFGPRLG
jgi:hypothetical protein